MIIEIKYFKFICDNCKKEIIADCVPEEWIWYKVNHIFYLIRDIQKTNYLFCSKSCQLIKGI